MVWTFLYHRLARVSLPHRRLHPRRDHKQQTTYTPWPARHCLALPGMPPDRLHCQLPAPAVPSPRRLLHLRRTRKWPCRLRVECMDWEHGRFKPDAGPIARRLWPRRGYGAACCDESDYRGQGGMVLFLLYHGKPAVHRELDSGKAKSTYMDKVACAAIELASCLWAFWDSDAAAFRQSQLNASNLAGQEGSGEAAAEEKGGVRRALFVPRYARVTWILAFFLLGYVGLEVAVGGWVVTFLMRVRDGAEFASGMGSTGYWLGITVGRVLLGFVTPRIGEKLAIAVCPCPYMPYHTHTPPGSKPNEHGLIDTLDIPRPRHRILSNLLACPFLLCFRRGSLLPRLLPRPHVSRRRCGSDPSPPARPARQRDRFRGCIRGKRCCYPAVCHWGGCAGERRGGPAAFCHCAYGVDFVALGRTPKDAEGCIAGLTGLAGVDLGMDEMPWLWLWLWIWPGPWKVFRRTAYMANIATKRPTRTAEPLWSGSQSVLNQQNQKNDGTRGATK